MKRPGPKGARKRLRAPLVAPLVAPLLAPRVAAYAEPDTSQPPDVSPVLRPSSKPTLDTITR